MHDGALQPYLPRLVREWAADGAETRARELGGSLVFVDVSGFTRLSERLARLGKEGAEELAEAINACFARLLAVAYGEGGTLLKFGGDALLLLFTSVEHEVRACRAAVGMRRMLRDAGRLETPAGRVVLRMSAGVHSGDIHCFLVGESHRELMLVGPAVSATVAMESAADAGEILVSRATAARLPAAAIGVSKGPGVLLCRAPKGLSPMQDHPDVGVADAVLSRYVPVAIRQHLTGGDQEPEHRQVTVAFIRFEGTDRLVMRSGSTAAVHLDRLVADIQQAVERHGVSFLASDIDRDGGKIILAAGAPVTRGDDDERMLLALREIVECERTLPVRIGVNRGSVFAGDIGPVYRRTYTVMGDAVNVAARLMGKAAPGEMLAATGVVERSRTRFHMTPLEPFMVKGKRRPVEALTVGRPVAITAPVAKSLPLLGRDPELDAVAASLARARAGAGGVVDIVGEPGFGKSRLLDEVRTRATGTRIIDLVCRPYESATPYAAFRAPLRSLLGIPAEADRQVAGQYLIRAVERLNPELRPWTPLIALVVDAEVEPTRESQVLDERFRRGRLRQAVVELLAVLSPDPTLIAVEDAHWSDEASADLLHHLCEQGSGHPWLICITRRETAHGFVPPAGDHRTELRIGPLPVAAARALGQAVTAADPLPQHALDAIVERAGGNPLFLMELVAATRQGGDLVELPASVEALIVARIDRLPPVARKRLRYLSVLGQSFQAELARAVLPDGLQLAGLDDFLVVEGGSVEFRHALIRDAAYESLPFRTRRKLHAVAGDVIAASTDEPDGHADILSFHFVHAERYADAWRYSLTAAEAARAKYANAAAAELYTRALAAARHVEDVAALESARIWEALGDVRNRMGRYSQAASAYQTSRRHQGDDPVAGARLMLKLARVNGWLRRYSQSLRWISRGLDVLDGLTSGEADRERAQLTAWYGHFLQEQGRHAEAITWCNRAVAVAEACGEREALAHAYRTLDWAHVCLGQLELAVSSGEALEVYQQLGDLTGEAHTFHNLASIAYLQGDWESALQYNRRAEALYQRIGNEVSVAFSQANMGEIFFDQGRLEEAEDLFTQVLRVSMAAGRRSLVAFARRHLGRIAAHDRRPGEALELLTEALAEYQDIGARVEVIETEVRIAEAHLHGGDADAGLLVAERAWEKARALGGVAAQLPAIHRTRGWAMLLIGRYDLARAAFGDGLVTARARHASFEIALCLRATMDLDRLEGRRVAAGLRQESEALLRRLGVVAPPRSPLPVSTVAGVLT